MLRVIKTYGHELGLSACFRQWRAKSHCRYLHGYALAFSFIFEAESLDENGWVIDFGSLKPLKEWLAATFDHKLLVAADDPALPALRALASNAGIVDMMILPQGVGCEAFARLAFEQAVGITFNLTASRARVVSCECREHGANGALYTPSQYRH